MDDAINLVEQQIRQNDNICSSPEALHTFPPSFYHPFKSRDIGFIVCRNGKFTFSVDDKYYTANKGETVFIPSNNLFQIIKHTEKLEIFLLIYKVAPIRDNLGTTVTSMNIYTKIYPHKHYVYHTGKEEELIRYISLINSTRKEHNNAFNTFEQKLLLIAVTYLLCSIFQQRMLQSNSLNARRTEVFLQLIRIIDKNYKKERGVEFYANQLCLSPKYLSGLCKSVCGYTVQEMVFKAIIRKSKTLLNITNMTIQEISNEFNFPNASSFGTFFKKQTGLSPQKYRESELGTLGNHEFFTDNPKMEMTKQA